MSGGAAVAASCWEVTFFWLTNQQQNIKYFVFVLFSVQYKSNRIMANYHILLYLCFYTASQCFWSQGCVYQQCTVLLCELMVGCGFVSVYQTQFEDVE